MIIYKKYFITKGLGESNVSYINAFDEALMDAGISEVNLVKVSSILPENCTEITNEPKLVIGEIVHCVLARIDGKCGDTISAGIACVHGKKNGKKYGLVMEAEGFVDKNRLKKELEKRVKSMTKLRNFKVSKANIVIETTPRIRRKYASAVVVLVYR